MVGQTKKSYIEKLEGFGSRGQPYYHVDDICGSSFHGLATTVEQQIQRGYVNDAMAQVDKCIRERQLTAYDNSHFFAIQILSRFYQKLQIIANNYVNFYGLLHTTLVRYNDTNHEFKITINDKTVGGKNKIKRRQTKKNKKTKLRFRYKKNKTLKKKKLKSK
jgi:acid stress-induced BolA-like protein IbaG/YrbA